jgi:hypothetical protein
MRGYLGEKIGEGAFSDVHAWAPGQVVKLFKAGVSQRLSRHEARVTRAVFVLRRNRPSLLTGADLGQSQLSWRPLDSVWFTPIAAEPVHCHKQSKRANSRLMRCNNRSLKHLIGAGK